MKQYVCAVCGYIHSGDVPPEVCPLCSAGQEAFLAFHADEYDGDRPIAAAFLNNWREQARNFGDGRASV
ncbi:MAG: hypothetical protein HRF49_11580 [bacterium]|jgi:hypothetical protein